jgi:hypothetical protein
MKRSPLRPVSPKRRANLTVRAEIRAQVLERDDYLCQFWTRAKSLDLMNLPHVPIACGGPLDVHEIIPRSAWADGYLVVDNCIAVCRRHHDWIGDYPELAAEHNLHGYSWDRPALTDGEDLL